MAECFKLLSVLLLIACLDPCGVKPCGEWSTCQPRANQTFVCLCLAGDWYNRISKSCEKVFPGQLILPELPYKAQMSDTSSVEFLKGSEEIIGLLKDVFSDSVGFLESTVLKLQEYKPQSRLWSREQNGVIATLDINFDTRTVITTEEVRKKIEKANCISCLLPGATFTSGDLCKKDHRYPCNDITTLCTSENGSYKCSCTVDYIDSAYSGRKMCIGCPSGQKVVNSKCVDCPFGFSGFNCSDPWLLILVIVGSILGGLLLITLILLPVVARVSSKKSSKKNKHADMRNPYVSRSAAGADFVNRGFVNSQTGTLNRPANAFTGVPRIPRATTPSSWDRADMELPLRNSW